MKITEKDLENFMIRATKHADLQPQELIELFDKGGLIAVYNLGLKHMLEYLQSRTESVNS